MEVILAEHAGFCFGVHRAVDTVYKQIQEQAERTDGGVPIYTYGPIIHNEEVVKDLESKGVRVLHDKEELEQCDGNKGGIVIIRSHGVEKSVCDCIERKGFQIVDATCPFVKRIHNIVDQESEKGKKIVIIGNAGHPEVEGIMGWCRNQAVVLESLEEAEKYTAGPEEEICIVSQTTFNYNKFQELVEIINKKGYDIIVLNTICNATEERQTQSRALAKEVEAMIVVGGKSSSNTQKLFEICKNECANTYYIQTIDDLDPAVLRTIDNVGITAGASTPNKIIEEVQNNVRNEF